MAEGKNTGTFSLPSATSEKLQKFSIISAFRYKK